MLKHLQVFGPFTMPFHRLPSQRGNRVTENQCQSVRACVNKLMCQKGCQNAKNPRQNARKEGGNERERERRRRKIMEPTNPNAKHVLETNAQPFFDTLVGDI